ncbi:MAG TPA: UPF0182 family protein [Microbacteriaceae bacterium]|nr:UPF0182 family protein [Microbacteriaceae bacterium]
MSAAPAETTKPRRSLRAAVLITIVVIVALIIAFFAGSSVATDFLWFDQTGYVGVLSTQWLARIAMFAIGFVAFAVPVFLSIFIAYRTRPVYAKLGAQIDRYREVIDPLRRAATFVIPAVVGVAGGAAVAGTWETVALWLNRTAFGQTDPEFGLDLSFYFFELPFYRGLVSFAIAVVVLSGIAALVTVFLYGSIRIVGRQIRISRSARVQLAITLGVFMLLQAGSIWLERYELLTDQSMGFLTTGAGYTEVAAIIPGKTILAGAALIVAVLAFITAAIGRWRLPIVGLASLIVMSILLNVAYPWIVQRFQVDPSAKTTEAAYIQRSIDATRTAYGVDGVEEIPYSAVTDATPGALREDAETTANIRILDPVVAPRAFQQLQQFKQYYSFSTKLDVDRYVIDGRVQDTVLAVREINQAGLGDSQSWYNNTLVYTHGYGLVGAYGNQRASDGQPLFLESGIPSVGELGEFEPRVYFGETSPEYSIVGAPEGTTPIEVDYPAGGAESTRTITTTFEGDGGPKLDTFWKRLIFAVKFQSEQILFSDAINTDSQIIYDRDPLTRVNKVAPYLTIDNDPYPAVVDGRIVWILDGYTTGTQYPYSEMIDLADAIGDADTLVSSLYSQPLNYIRNSVKATVDAYDGTVTLYAWDTEDPVLATWSKIYPGTIVDASEMSEDLLAHIRYPEDLFKVQRLVLGSYHVTDPGSFYSSDDQWATPLDPVSTAGNLAQPPYYLTMQVPGTSSPAFTLYSTYIPRASASAQRNVLTGYLAANGDAGEDYGKLTLLTLPTQSIPAPSQVFNYYSSNQEVSDVILGLRAGGGNDIIYGNLLTLPVGGGLLYVQPVYVQSASSTTPYPLLRKVLAVFGNEIAFEDTLDQALDSLFGGDSGASAGDSGDVVDPLEPTEPTDPVEPTTPVTPVTPTEPTTPSGSLDEAALRQALSDYQSALADRQAAYARGDLVAAGQADQRMIDAINRALAASGD